MDFSLFIFLTVQALEDAINKREEILLSLQEEKCYEVLLLDQKHILDHYKNIPDL